ncbi:hypothetical protein OE88DRAFT_1654688 [Heliocybe sulcata]|uniref:Uncharacterized protein n=1 Tax=Heliocybe sulcata TaxID=5364 RepID=A0A5C3NAW8_9AGAM|nr:hypothetical protein OE88DRAFT_1654688 [Heliocybe sulcata]
MATYVMHEFRTPACPQREKDSEGAINMVWHPTKYHQHTVPRKPDEKTYDAMQCWQQDRLENHTAEQTTYPMLMKHMQLPPPTSTVSSGGSVPRCPTALSPPTFDARPSLFS